jgi:hypothetical protein
VLVTTADAEKGLHAISYKSMSDDMRKVVRELREKLEGVDVIGAGAADDGDDAATADAEPESSTDSDLLAEAQEWTNRQGQSITAAVQAVSTDKVMFVMPDGKVVPYPLVKLSDESRKKIEELAK